MRKLILIATIAILMLAGCQAPVTGEFVTVDFQPEKTLTYNMTAQRNITLTLSDDPKAGKPQKMSEKLELVIAYTPTQVDPYGLTVIEAKCISAKVTRKTFTNKSTPKDAVEHLKGQTFTFPINSSGQIDDMTDIVRVINSLGEKAFAAQKSDRGRIKNDDMIMDFVAMQSYLWGTIAAVEFPENGIVDGQTWTLEQVVPLPMPINAARTTTCTMKFAPLTELEESPSKATITSTYAIAPPATGEWPMPYTGTFRMRGMFGFLRNYQPRSLDGTGTQIFDVKTGTVISDEQNYKAVINASFMMALKGAQPKITIDQTISIQLQD